MKAKGGNWTYDELNKFLASPRGYISGTNMTFAGLSREQQRADVIAYLRTLSDNPAPLPKAEARMPRRRRRRGKPARSRPGQEVTRQRRIQRGRATPGRIAFGGARPRKFDRRWE